MVGGWLTSELAPHLLSLTAGRRRPRAGAQATQPRRARAGGRQRAGPGRAGRGGGPGTRPRRRRPPGGARRRLPRPAPRHLHRPRPVHAALPAGLAVPACTTTRSRSSGTSPTTRPTASAVCSTSTGSGVRRATTRRCCSRCTAAPGRLGSKEEQGVPLMLHMAARGWVCVAINYRLSPRDPFPAQVDRREAGDRLGQASTSRTTAATPASWPSPAARPAATWRLWPRSPRATPSTSRASRTRTPPSRPPSPSTASTTSPGRSAPAAPCSCGTGSSRTKVLFDDPATDPRAFEQASPILRVHRGRSPDVRDPRPPRLAGGGGAGPPVRRRAARRRDRPVAYAELPGTQHAFDVFPSIRTRGGRPRRRALPALDVRRRGPAAPHA